MTTILLIDETTAAYRKLDTACRGDDAAAIEKAVDARWAAFDKLRRTRVSSPGDLMAKVRLCIVEMRHENDVAVLEMLESLRRDLAALGRQFK